MRLCFWCQLEKPDEEIAKTYAPCKACKLIMGQGITLIEIRAFDIQKPLPQIEPGKVPTGRWRVEKEPNIRRVLNHENAEAVIAARRAFVEEKIYTEWTRLDG